MPNPVLTPQVDRLGELLPPKTIIAVGRLDAVKGFDRAIRALAKVKDRHPDWQLVILGEGPQRGELEALRDELGLEDRVKLPGRVNNVDDYLAQAELYILSSLIEGFPMGMCEAMAVGLPVLSVDCLSGPADIIRPEIDGILVPQDDPDALSDALDRLLGDAALRARLAQAAPQVLDRFGLERVMQIWSDVIKSIVRPD
jgi:GalNAc-alpha-(1->4)-GalNAc-alpha-(1->3)-diNAcBac-PP-undecaprenol alpha-1,4-N-acetyl-D-galactosaminyltransferase